MCDSIVNGQECQVFTAHRSKLRRVVSVKSLNKHIDSSESFPSEHSSVFDGILASFETENNELQVGDAEDTRRSNHLGSNPDELDSSHSGWPCHTLDTISERPSVSTLYRSLPASRLNQGKSSNVSMKNGLTPGSSSVKKNAHSPRVYSFDDLDIPTTPKAYSFNTRSRSQLQRSSSSDASYNLIYPAVSPISPKEPIYPPPTRTPTPPGLPSFGSREAMRYSISLDSRTPAHSPSHDSRPRWSCRSSQSPSDTNSNDARTLTCCGIGLRRLLGLSSFRRDSDELPQGAVARASDGTIIRGRFGARHSGHGVGAGPGYHGLGNHPFHSDSLPIAGTGNTGTRHSTSRGNKRDYRLGPNTFTLGVSLPTRSSFEAQHNSSSYRSLLTVTGPRRASGSHSRTPSIDQTNPTPTSGPTPAHTEQRDSRAQSRFCSEVARPQPNANVSRLSLEGGTNDGSSSTTFQSAPVFMESRSLQQESSVPSENHSQHPDKPAGPWKLLWKDCLWVCCGFDNDDESITTANHRPTGRCAASFIEPSQGTMTEVPGSENSQPTPRSAPVSHDHYSIWGNIESNPWIPAWGYRSRYIDGCAAVTDATETPL